MLPRRITVLLLLLIWYSPIFLPDDYSGLAGEKKEIAVRTQRPSGRLFSEV